MNLGCGLGAVASHAMRIAGSAVLGGLFLIVACGKSYALLGTTTSVASSANPSAFGQSVTFTATVTGLVLVPTGTVTFRDNGVSIGSDSLNGSGKATFSTGALSTGSHTITAHYNGDAVYNPSTSPGLTQNVNQNSSSVALISSLNPSSVTQSVTFTATVSGAGGTPSGTVTFKDGAITLGTGSLSAGQASLSSSALLPGNHSITATYGGDSNYGTSSSPALVQSVGLLQTTTSVVSSANPSAFGQSVTFTVTVSGLILPPSGTVTFKDGATTLGSGTLDGAGQATFSTSLLAVGAHSITAVYGGDLIYAGSTSPALAQNVSANASSTGLISSVNPSALGQSVTFTATVSGSAATPTGSVTFKDGGITLGTGALDAAGQATFTSALLLPGPHTITAVYGGDNNYATSTSPPLTQTVAIGASATAVISSVNPSAFGQSVTFTATVTGLPLLTPAGTVTFKDSAATLGTVGLDAGGQAAFSTGTLAAGSHTITATYNGGLIYSASISPGLSQTVNQAASSTSVVSSLNPSALGQSVTFTATVSGGGGTPSGSVTFKDGAAVLGSGNLNGSGQASFSSAALTLGSHSVTAVYGGDTNFATSSSPVLTQQVNANGSSTGVTSSLNPTAFGQSVTFTATVTSAGGTPTGSVTFKDGAGTLGTGPLNGSGQATFSTAGLAAGSHAISAVYAGDASFGASTSPVLTQTVHQSAGGIALASSLNPSALGQSVTFTATVSGPGGTPTGSVSFKQGATLLGSGTLNASGQASFATTVLTAGSHAISASYAGDANFSAVTSAPLTQIISPNASAISLSSSLNPSPFGAAVTFTATVLGAGGTPTGTVTFIDGGTTIGTGALNGSGQASFTIAALSGGTHRMTASYGGDSRFGASSSLALRQTVIKSATVTTLSSSLNPSLRGQSVVFTAIVTGSGGTPQGKVHFRDGDRALGSTMLDASGSAGFATAALAPGSHAITASYAGHGAYGPSSSSPLSQAVSVPSDSVKLRELQLAVTKLEAQGAGQAFSGAVDRAIAEAFADDAQSLTPNGNGLHLNFSAGELANRRVGNAFAALDAKTQKAPAQAPQQWFTWVDVRATGWNVYP